MAKSRKPRLNIGPATTEGTAFDGAFGAATPPVEAPSAETESPEPKAKRKRTAKAPGVGPAKPVQRPEAPAPGDDAYERTVQGNWNVPAWMRAKVRAAAEEGGASQNDFVQEALQRHIEEAERSRGGGFALEARHFGNRRGR
ncbi:hypothetical protein B1759_16110 [Rubrivirga sp. SAORIC476]|uniref:hypothetical protein n=1 Tax=Rubrivirga sp. SAORIC476 TaxID=1961794 RepID=UPI000BA925E9|nr:hypothetical protein [Rubrivirga sp. SAORIC476]PAP78957.1 hypothetical protein B1759_16110 [Rubrivirga sp. SAORIC476]